MAEAENQEKKWVSLGDFVSDEKSPDLAPNDWPNVPAYAGTYGNNARKILEEFQDTSMGEIVNYNARAVENWFFSTVIPRYTGVSLCYCHSQNNDNMQVWLWDKEYKVNPNSAPGGDWKSSFPEHVGGYAGFKPHQWSCEVTVTNEDLTESKKVEAQNDNSLFWEMKCFDGTAASLRKLKTLKFSFAGNRYKVVNSAKSGGTDCALVATGSGEALAAVKTKEGFLAMNWAIKDKYKGEGRKADVSLNKGYSAFLKFVMELNSLGIITVDGDGY